MVLKENSSLSYSLNYMEYYLPDGIRQLKKA